MTPPRSLGSAIVTSIAGTWNRFWFRPTSAFPLAAFRILFSVYLLAYFGAYLPHVEIMYSSTGVYTPYALPDYAPPPPFAWAIYMVLMGVIVLFGLGLRARLTTPLLLMLFLYHYFLNLAEKHSSFDRLIIVFLVALCVGEPARVWSLDARRRPPSDPKVSAFAGRLVMVQLVVLYVGAGLWKAFNPAWQQGDMLRNTFHGMWASSLGFWLAAELPAWSWPWLTRGAYVFEILLGLALVFRRTRVWGVLAGTLFHTFNWAALAIPEFMVCVAAYPLFLPSQWTRRLGEKLGRLVRR